jgi:hypothetical protein
MALTSITKDFVVKAGLTVEGTAALSTSTGTTGALQVNGGVAIGKNLIVGTTATIYGNTTLAGNLNVSGQSTLNSLTATNFTATSAHIIGDATVDVRVITPVVTSTSTLIIGAGGVTGNVEIQNNGYATQFLPTGQIRPSGALIGGSGDSNQVDVTNTGSLQLKGLSSGVQITAGINSSTTYTWTFGTDGTLTNPGQVIVNSSQTAISTSSGALQVVGGVGVGKDVFVGGSIHINTGTIATTSGDGALSVVGGAYIGKNLIVSSMASNTATDYSNALYVQGGAWIKKNLTVEGPTTFSDTVTFNGTATYVYSTNTYYTDNIIELHTPPTGVDGAWDSNDGKDIGIRIHYYGSGADQNAALVLANDSKYLEWYGSGAESNTGTFTTAGYGTFKTGSIILTNTDDGGSTTTGALQIAGGAGIGGHVYIGSGLQVVGDISGAVVSSSKLKATSLQTATNTLVYADNLGELHLSSISLNGGTLSGTISTATNLSGGATGSLPYQTSAGITTMLPIGGETTVLTVSGGVPTWQSAGSTTVGNASNAVTATNIASGLANQIPYQSSPGVTTFSSGLTFNGTTFTATNISVVSNNNSTSTTSGALTVKGGVGITQNLWVGGDVNIGGILYFNGVGADQVTSNTGTFVDVAITGTGVALTVTNSVFIGQNLQVNNVLTSTNIVVSGNTGVTSTNSGALQVIGGVGVGGGLVVGGTVTATNVLINTSSVSLGATLNVSGGSYFTGNVAVTGITTITNATSVASTNTGALQVEGGVGIGGGLVVGGTTTSTTLNVTGQSVLGLVTATAITATSLTVSGQSILGATTATIFTATAVTVSGTLGVTGQSTLGAVTATVFTATSANIIGNETVGGTLTVNDSTDSTLTTNGAIVTQGGIGVAKSVIVGGTVTIGSVTTGSVAAIYSNNSLYSSFTSNVINSSAKQQLDNYSSTAYRTAKYLIQIVDGTKVHIEEILVFHDVTYVYMSEYGITTNTGELGTFDATINGGLITLNFTPNYTPSSMTIKVVRTTITF